MKIDLCKLFGVEEGEEFKFDKGVNYPRNNTYFIKDNTLLYKNEQCNIVIEESNLAINTLKQIKEIIRLPKKKKFTEDELCILRNIDKKYKWIARNRNGDLWIYTNEPKKEDDGHWRDCYSKLLSFEPLDIFKNSLFTEIKWEDEEPVYIDDYVER